MKIEFAENSMKKWCIRYISCVSENVYPNREMRNRRINNTRMFLLQMTSGIYCTCCRNAIQN